MIRRIHIKGYKSLADVEVRLPALSVLIGPNAAGKSNFLDALQLLSGLGTCRTLKDAFLPPYRGTPLESFTFGPHGVQGLLEHDSVRFSIEADVVLSDAVVAQVDKLIRDMRGLVTGAASGKEGEAETPERPKGEPQGQSFVKERNLRYRLEVEIRPKKGLLFVVDEYLAALSADREPTGKRKPFLECLDKRLCLRMEGQGHPTSYDLGLDHTVLSKPHYPPHYPHMTAMRQELASWLFFYFEPRERMRAPNPVKEVRHMGSMGEELASFLNTLKALDEKQFAAVEKALRVILPGVSRIQVEVNNLGQVELNLIEKDVPIPARLVSEGTLRLLGLLALGGAKDAPALIGFEEPENGIHPRRIRWVAELLKSRAAAGVTQLIVTSHSPLFADLMPKESLLVCRRKDAHTVISPLATWGDLGKAPDIEKSLEGEEPAVSARILRGDFDA